MSLQSVFLLQPASVVGRRSAPLQEGKEEAADGMLIKVQPEPERCKGGTRK